MPKTIMKHHITTEDRTGRPYGQRWLSQRLLIYTSSVAITYMAGTKTCNFAIFGNCETQQFTTILHISDNRRMLSKERPLRRFTSERGKPFQRFPKC